MKISIITAVFLLLSSYAFSKRKIHLSLDVVYKIEFQSENGRAWGGFVKHHGRRKTTMRLISERGYVVDQDVTLSFSRNRLTIDGSNPVYIKHSSQGDRYSADHFYTKWTSKGYVGHLRDDANVTGTCIVKVVSRKGRLAFLRKLGWGRKKSSQTEH